jgi:hypothetical protein
MSKKRIVDSRIRQSQTFHSLTYRQRDLWQGMIAVADDQGRLPGTPALVRSAVWPNDDITLKEVADDLEALEQLGNVLIYSTNSGTFCQLVNWWKYQVPQWAGPSDYPAPPGWTDRMRYHGKKHEVMTENWDTPGGFIESSKTSGELPDLPPSKPPSSKEENDLFNNVNDKENDLKDIGGEPPKPPAKRKAKTSDPRSKTPAILAAQGVSGKYPPLEIYDTVIQTLGESPDGKKLAACRREWVERGYNPTSWKWLTEWYVSGIPPRGHPGNNNEPPERQFREVY